MPHPKLMASMLQMLPLLKTPAGPGFFQLPGWLLNPWVLGGLALAVIAAIGIVVVAIILIASGRRKDLPQSAPTSGAVQDSRGNWWLRDPQSGGWQVWNGRKWIGWQGPPPQLAGPQLAGPQIAGPQISAPRQRPIPAPRPRSGCLLTLVIMGGMAVLVFGVLFLITFNFFPGWSIPPLGASTTLDILKVGGISLLLAGLGALSLHGGLRAIRTRRANIEVGNEYYSQTRQVTGCRAVWAGLGQTGIGLVFLLIGLVGLALTIYLQVLPWLGF